MPAVRPNPSDEDIKAALEANWWIKAASARALGISRQMLVRRLEANPALTVSDAERDAIISDLAMMNIHRAIGAGDVKAALWYLQKYGFPNEEFDRREERRKLTASEFDKLIRQVGKLVETADEQALSQDAASRTVSPEKSQES